MFQWHTQILYLAHLIWHINDIYVKRGVFVDTDEFTLNNAKLFGALGLDVMLQWT